MEICLCLLALFFTLGFLVYAAATLAALITKLELICTNSQLTYTMS